MSDTQPAAHPVNCGYCTMFLGHANTWDDVRELLFQHCASKPWCNEQYVNQEAGQLHHEPSPRPWDCPLSEEDVSMGYGVYIDKTHPTEAGRLVADAVSRADALHIVRCVNSHDALVAALRNITEAYTDLRRKYEHACALVHYANETPAMQSLPDSSRIMENGAKAHPRTGNGFYAETHHISVRYSVSDLPEMEARAALKAVGQ